MEITDEQGAFFSLMPTTVASLTDPAIMASGFGLLVTGWGAGYLLGPPIAGYLLQATGGESAGIAAYRPAMFYSGSLTVASCLMIIGMKFKTAKSLRKKM
jgi:MFS family permease